MPAALHASSNTFNSVFVTVFAETYIYKLIRIVELGRIYAMYLNPNVWGPTVSSPGGGDYFAQLRRQQRLQQLQVAQMMTPASSFARRQYTAFQRSRPQATPNYNLPKCHDLKTGRPTFPWSAHQLTPNERGGLMCIYRMGGTGELS